MVFIMMFVSAIVGFCFAFGVGVGAEDSILYVAGVLVPKEAWGATLMLASSVALGGLTVRNDSMVSLGGIVGFMAWLFACIGLAAAGNWYVFVTVALFHLSFQGYVVLASSLGYIRRRPID